MFVNDEHQFSLNYLTAYYQYYPMIIGLREITITGAATG